MDPLPPRPVLLPGLHVLERGNDEVQVGLDPAHAVVLPATAALRRTLAVLRVGGPAADADPESLHHLHRLGLVADAGRLPRPPVPRVAVRTFGAAPLPPLPELLHTAGLDVVPTAAGAGVMLVAGVGEPDRDLLDPYVRDGVPHLVVRLTEGDAVVGPFVVPGRTACLRCVDAHHAEADVRLVYLRQQQTDAFDEAHLDHLRDRDDERRDAAGERCAEQTEVRERDAERPQRHQLHAVQDMIRPITAQEFVLLYSD